MALAVLYRIRNQTRRISCKLQEHNLPLIHLRDIPIHVYNLFFRILLTLHFSHKNKLTQSKISWNKNKSQTK